jgi:isoquinoline 1-oxidoreductase subunit alpha
MPTYTFTLNGQTTTVDAPADTPLLWVLRERLGLTGTKYGCGTGDCGSCTVLRNGIAIQTCTLPLWRCDGQTITTIEGLATGAALHPVQQAWLDEDVSQCGFCQAGQIMSAVALLARTGNAPTDADIDAIDNVCRCGTYGRIRSAIKRAASTMGGGGNP